MPTTLQNILINCRKAEMISFMKSNPEFFDEAVQLAISDDQPYARRQPGCCGVAWKRMIRG
ncbi:MAG: hypothetical protein HC906_15415 [Bacteroidales bacterium]|nr:hypothetical protein [Bacteroidales bacterium]